MGLTKGEGRSGARAPLVLLLAAIALISQWFVAPTLNMPASAGMETATRVAAELKAIFGDTAVICIQAGEESPTPGHSHVCDDACPICQLHMGGLALLAPSAAFLSAPLDGAVEARGSPHAIPTPLNRRLAQAQPRAPPVQV